MRPRKEVDRLLATAAGPKIRQELEALVKGSHAQAEGEFDAGFKRANQHDTLLDICVSAFGPSSELYNDFGFAFISSEPLVELAVKNFDALIFQSSKKYAIFVECKSSLTAPARIIEDVYASVEETINRKAYLERKIGDEIRISEYVVCVPSEIGNNVIREIERRESQGLVMAGAPLLRVWTVNKFEDQLLQLDPRIGTRHRGLDARHLDGDLTKSLAEGVRVSEAEVLVKCYPSSHPLRKGIEVLRYLTSRYTQAETPAKEFTRHEAVAFFSDAANLPHYALDEVGPKIAERFLREGIEFGLVTQKQGLPDHFELQVEGKSPKTLIKNYQRHFRDSWIQRSAERKAEKAILEKYQHMYPAIDSFGP